MLPPLQGKTIVVTRPLAQSAKLAGLIAAQGGVPVVFPLLDIAPADDQAPLRAAIEALEQYALAVFISPNAVDYSVPAILASRKWPAGLQAAAIGQSSVVRLASYGVAPTIAPRERFDSEALLELPELQSERVSGQRVVIFRGNGGRPFLADTLRERGAHVDYVTCYHRLAPTDASPLVALWERNQLDALTVSSSEGLRNLVDLLDAPGRERLRNTPVFVPHERIAEIAETFGLRRVTLTGPADAGIIDGLCAYNWQQSHPTEILAG
jgi:uroporphyrinogen-III synthase